MFARETFSFLFYFLRHLLDNMYRSESCGASEVEFFFFLRIVFANAPLHLTNSIFGKYKRNNGPIKNCGDWFENANMLYYVICQKDHKIQRLWQYPVTRRECEKKNLQGQQPSNKVTIFRNKRVLIKFGIRFKTNGQIREINTNFGGLLWV